jgi:hypothetical protein
VVGGADERMSDALSSTWHTSTAAAFEVCLMGNGIQLPAQEQLCT